MVISRIDSGTNAVPRYQKIPNKPESETAKAPDTIDSTSTQDTTILSGQAQEGQKAAIHTGMAGNMGAKETRKKDEVERKTSEDGETLTKKEREHDENSAHLDMTGNKTNFSPFASLYGAIPNESRNADTQAGAGVPPGNGPPNNPPSASDIAAKQKAVQDDMQQAQTIYAQMAAERQKWLMKMWEIIQDTQTKIMEIMEGAAVKRSKSMDTIAAKWAACLGGYEYK